MTGGYMGKILFVDLSTGEIKEETLEEKMCRDFIGGYGIGARILYSRQKAGVDPLGPENTLGLITGPLTGTGVPTGTRYRPWPNHRLPEAGEMPIPADISVPISNLPVSMRCSSPGFRRNRFIYWWITAGRK